MKRVNVLKWVVLILALSINIFILVNAFINGEASAKESNIVAHTAADVVNTVKPETVTQSNFDHFAYDIRKLFGHFGLFVLSGTFSSWALYLFVRETKLRYFLWQLLITFVFGFLMAISSEFVQVFVDGRTGSFVDVGIDFSGYFCGVFLVFLILLIKKSTIFKKHKI